MNGVAVIIEKFRSDKDELRNRVGEATGREPNRVVLPLDDYLRLVADIVQASVLRNRAKWLDSLVAIVKDGECDVDPFDQSRVPESPADAAVKLLCIFARMSCDDIFAEAAEQFPQPTWDGKELAFDAKREFLHELHVRCRGVWVETKHPTSRREAFDGGVGQKPVEPMTLVPTEMNGGLSFSVLESELERWLELGFGRVFGEPVAQGAGRVDREKPAQPKRKNVNARMLEEIQRNSNEAIGWNSHQWARHLKCSPSSVTATETWKNLESARVRAKAELRNDKRRRTKENEQFRR